MQKHCNLMWSHLFIFALAACAFGIFLKKSLPTPMSFRVFLMFSSRNLILSGFNFGTLIHLGMIFTYGKVGVLIRDE